MSRQDLQRRQQPPVVVAMTGASRATVREAVARLEADGLITKRWGVGTFVAEPPTPVGVGFLSLDGGIPGVLGSTGGEVSVLRFETSEEAPDPASFPDFFIRRAECATRDSNENCSCSNSSGSARM